VLPAIQDVRHDLRVAIPSFDHPPGSARQRVRFRAFRTVDIGLLLAGACTKFGCDATAGLPPLYAPESEWRSRPWRRPASGARSMEWTLCPGGAGCLLGYACLHHLDTPRPQCQMHFWAVRDLAGRADAVQDVAAECARAIVAFGMDTLALERVYALQLIRQPRLGTVLAAAGLQEEGRLRQRLCRDGLMEDIACWGITAEAWRTRQVE